jgi:ADP-heptose:LPS heptosyltransferase
LANTSPELLAARIAESAQRRELPDQRLIEQLTDLALDPTTAVEATRTLFRDVVEPLSDSFDPAGVEAYNQIFSQVITRAMPEISLSAAALQQRGQRAAKLRKARGNGPFNQVSAVVIPSRVTIGADIAVTSVLLQAAKRSMPEARILFVGPEKNLALWQDDQEIEKIPLAYARSATLRDRLAVFGEIRDLLDRTDAILLDPDSRLTQLGLLPVCPVQRHFLFDSRSYGWETDWPLSMLAAKWCGEVLDFDQARPYISLQPVSPTPESQPLITVSLGVGDNLAKRFDDRFERDLLEFLCTAYPGVLVDSGGSAEERQRVKNATSGPKASQVAKVFEGSFADFARRIYASDLYVGYDSAGQHAAAALETKLVTIFRGYPSERFLKRWTPVSKASGQVIFANEQPLAAAKNAIAQLQRPMFSN